MTGQGISRPWEQKMTRHNVLLITTDQEQSPLDIPKSVHLPNHDRLRERSTYFENFHVNSTPCGPSRSVIFSGQHTQKTGMFVNPNVPPHPELPRTMPTLGTIFQELGYYTVYKGKWHLSHLNQGIQFDAQRFPETSRALEPWGFSEYNHDGDHHGIVWDGFKHDHAIAADAANWLLGIDGGKPTDRPWLLAVNFINPHDIMFHDATGQMSTNRLDPVRVAPLKPAPHTPPYTDDLELSLPESFSDNLDNKPTAHRNDRTMAEYMFGRLPIADEQAWRNHRNYYYNCIRDVDRHIGCVLDALEQSGDAANTIIVFTSDHGEMAGAHGLRQKGPSMYKENVRVPLFIRHPEIQSPAETQMLATSIDLIPTILEMTETSNDEVQSRWPDLVGTSVVPALQGKASERDQRGALFNYTATLAWDINFVETLFKGQVRGQFTDAERERLAEGMSLDQIACFRGIHDGRYKFARYFKPSEHHVPEDWNTLVSHNELELYDTLNDPNEINNLANTSTDNTSLILDLNERLNMLIQIEIGVDDGSFYGTDREYKLGDQR